MARDGKTIRAQGGRIYPRAGRLVLAFKDATGRWQQRRTSYTVGQEAAAELLLAEIREALETGKEWSTGPLTVRAYAARWIEGRKSHVASWKDDLARLEQHVLPSIGDMLLADVRPRHLRTLIQALRLKAAKLRSLEDAPRKLAPRTIRSVYSAASAMFRDAALEGLIEHSPAILRRETLPKVRDANPTWRQSALFTAGEAESLISDPRIPEDRRIFYALLFLAGCRFGEAAALRWRALEEAEPLDRFTVSVSYSAALKKEKGTKSETSRVVPVHPVLAKMLAGWKLRGWIDLRGRVAGPDDLIVPSRKGTFRSAQHMLKRFHEDCDRLGLRRRRLHDTRRTFISLALAGGADRESVRWIAHGRPADVLGFYTEADWSRLCAAVLAVRIELLEGRVVELRRAGNEVIAPAAPATPGETWADRGQGASASAQALGITAEKLAGCTGLEFPRSDPGLPRVKPEVADFTGRQEGQGGQGGPVEADLGGSARPSCPSPDPGRNSDALERAAGLLGLSVEDLADLLRRGRE